MPEALRDKTVLGLEPQSPLNLGQEVLWRIGQSLDNQSLFGFMII